MPDIELQTVVQRIRAMKKIARLIFYGLGLLSAAICWLCIEIACEDRPLRIDATSGYPGQPTTHSFHGLVTTSFREEGKSLFTITEVNKIVFIPLAVLAAIPVVLCLFRLLQGGLNKYSNNGKGSQIRSVNGIAPSKLAKGE